MIFFSLGRERLLMKEILTKSPLLCLCVVSEVPFEISFFNCLLLLLSLLLFVVVDVDVDVVVGK